MPSRLSSTGFRLAFWPLAVAMGWLAFKYWTSQTAMAGMEKELAGLQAIQGQKQPGPGAIAEAELARLRRDVEERRRLIAEIAALRQTRVLSEEAEIAALREERKTLLEEEERLEAGALHHRRTIDVVQLEQIAQAFKQYAELHQGKLPEDFSELRFYSSAEVFPTLETNRFEFLPAGVGSTQAEPSQIPVVRSKAKDDDQFRAYLFADGHLEWKQEQ